MTRAELRRRARSQNSSVALRAMEKLGILQPVAPTTSSGWTRYDNGRQFLPAGTNHVDYPSWGGTWADDTPPTGWSLSHAGVANAVTFVKGTEVIDGVSRSVLTVNYVPGAGETTGNFNISMMSAASTWAAGEPCTASVYARTNNSAGVRVRVISKSYTDAPAYISGGDCQSSDMTMGLSSWTRYSATLASAPATTARKTFMLEFALIAEGDVCSVSFAMPMLEKSAVLTPYFDGTTADCAWTGTAHASTSTRAASALVYPLSGAVTQAAGTLASRITQAGGTYCAWFSFGSVQMWQEAPATATIYTTDPGAKTATRSITNTAGYTGNFVGRWGATTLDIMVSGTAGTQTAIGGVGAAPSTFAMGPSATASATYQKPVILGPSVASPYRITDAETATLSAGLTAGWGAVELTNFFRQRGYLGTLIIPLNGNSNAYKLVS